LPSGVVHREPVEAAPVSPALVPAALVPAALVPPELLIESDDAAMSARASGCGARRAAGSGSEGVVVAGHLGDRDERRAIVVVSPRHVRCT
jgi:hypothetical protein